MPDNIPGAADDDQVQVPAIHPGDLDGVLCSWPRLGLDLAVAGIRGENQQMEDFALCVTLPFKQINKRYTLNQELAGDLILKTLVVRALKKTGKSSSLPKC